MVALIKIKEKHKLTRDNVYGAVKRNTTHVIARVHQVHL